MQKAVFLDRDGVINDGSLYYTYRTQDFVINKGVIEGLTLLIEHGFILIVITNQSGVAKGIYTESDVEQVHDYMRQILGEHNIPIQHVYYCPHHPSVAQCLCRKPGTQLFETAIRSYDIDTRLSYMIGDSPRDIEAAAKVGVAGFLIQKNENILPYCEKIVGL